MNPKLLQPFNIGDPTEYRCLPVIVEELNGLTRPQRRKYISMLQQFHRALRACQTIPKSSKRFIGKLIERSYMEKVWSKPHQKESSRLSSYLCNYIKARVSKWIAE